jgi:hypothetical protein
MANLLNLTHATGSRNSERRPREYLTQLRGMITSSRREG